MNQRQVEYAMARASKILKLRRVALKAECTKAEARLSGEDILKAMNAGEYSIRPLFQGENKHWPPLLRDFIVLDAERPEFVSEDFAQRAAGLEAQHAKLADEQMLGSDTEALRLLREFEGTT